MKLAPRTEVLRISRVNIRGVRIIGILRLGHARYPRLFARLYVKDSCLRVECASAPIRASQDAGKNESALQAGWRVERAETILLHLRDGFGSQFGSKVEGIVQRNSLWSDRRRAYRHGLGRGRFLTGNIAGRRRALFNRPNWRAAHSIEHEDVTHLSELDGGIDLAARHRERHKIGRGRQVIV